MFALDKVIFILMLSKRFSILLEIAKNQPSVRQKELAHKLGITPQAVSEYMKELIARGYLESRGPVNYTLTRKSYDFLLKSGRELKNTSKYLLDDLLEDFNILTAIATVDVKEGEILGLKMEEGLLYAGDSRSPAKGRAINSSSQGEEVGISQVEGVIDLEPGRVKILVVPGVEEGGSRNADLEALERNTGNGLLGALGVEGLIALRKVKREPQIFFGVRSAVLEAAYHGISSVVVGAEDEVESLIGLLERNSIDFEVQKIKK